MPTVIHCTFQTQELTTSQRLGLATLILKVKEWEIENGIQLGIAAANKKAMVNRGISSEIIGDKRKLTMLTKSLADSVRSFGKSGIKRVETEGEKEGKKEKERINRYDS